MTDFQKLRAHAEAATPGKRKPDLGIYEDPDGENDYAFARGPMVERSKFKSKEAWRGQTQADADLAAALDRETVLALLDEIEYWRSEIEKYMSAMNGVSEASPSELAEIYVGTCEVRDRLRHQLFTVTAQRDQLRGALEEACRLFEGAINELAEREEDPSMLDGHRQRLAELRKVGTQ